MVITSPNAHTFHERFPYYRTPRRERSRRVQAGSGCDCKQDGISSGENTFHVELVTRLDDALERMDCRGYNVVVIFSILAQALTMGRLVRRVNRDATLEPPGQKS